MPKVNTSKLENGSKHQVNQMNILLTSQQQRLVMIILQTAIIIHLY
jgi:hypothetical protein